MQQLSLTRPSAHNERLDKNELSFVPELRLA